MEVTIKIPAKFVEIVKGIMLGACTNEADEKALNDVMATVTAAENPILVDPNTTFGDSTEDRAHYSQLMLSITSLAMVQIKTEADARAQPKSALTQRIEALQREAEELKRKLNGEGEA